MEIEMTELGGGVVLKPDDGLDLLGYQELAGKLGDVLSEGVKIVIIDLERVTYVSSSVVRMLLAMSERAKAADGVLALARAHEGAVAMLEAGGALGAMKAYDSIQDAMLELGVV